MSQKYQCPKCLIYLSSKQMLDFHLYKRKKPCTSEFICPQCLNQFSRADSLQRHLERHCSGKNEIKLKISQVNSLSIKESSDDEVIHDEVIDEMSQLNISQSKISSLNISGLNIPPSNNRTLELEQEIDFLKKRIEEIERNDLKYSAHFEKLESEPRIINNNQILQILCVNNNQNYLNMLTEQWGDYNRALGFIKDCALSSLTGDCKLLQRIYFSSNNPNEFPIKYLDKNRRKLKYLDENKEKVIDPQGTRLAKILANNLQNSYLQGVNYLINQTLDNKNCPNHFLEEYDIQSWNNHIYELSDVKYQKKIISNLEIPSLNQ